MINKYIIEGIDRLGKDTLINGIRNELGYFEVIHFAKPQELSIYSIVDKRMAYALYQSASFENMARMLRSDAKFIFNRAHLGEYVYSPLYRGYDGSYVFTIEKLFEKQNDVRLILLTEDFSASRHFVDDGLSFDVSMREAEQKKFIEAFHKSSIADKRIINVTADNGQFRSKEEILLEALK